jgi:hypothetical protein
MTLQPGLLNPSLRRWLTALGLAMAIVLPAKAESADSEARVKATFLLSFLQFVSFPTRKEPEWTLCVFGDDAVGPALERYANRTVRDRRVVVRQAVAVAAARACHLYYVPASAREALAAAIAHFRTAPVLVVTDFEGGAQLGAGISFLLRPDGRLGFDIGLDSARQQGIELSSYLVQLARRVY